MAEELLMETGWLEELGSEFSAPYMQRLKSFLILEKKLGRVLYPPENLIFNALCQTPFAKVKAVIVGQDPYHGKNQAHGLCFSVPKGVRIPPSLQNIFKELEQDLGLPPPASGDLSFWAKQGVLLLNATLTVREAEPLSHFGQGWEEFTDRIIEKLTKRSDPLVFLLWGKSAQQKVGRVFSKSPEHPHLILQASHPSFYSASGFFGCRHFSQTNRFLMKNGKKPIDWQIL